MDIYKIIEKYNLAIRRIPDKVCDIYSIQHLQEGDEIIELTNGVKRCKRYYAPKNAGKYMVKSINNNMSTVTWNPNSDNLSDTLDGSINLFLAKIEDSDK